MKSLTAILLFTTALYAQQMKPVFSDFSSNKLKKILSSDSYSTYDDPWIYEDLYVEIDAPVSMVRSALTEKNGLETVSGLAETILENKDYFVTQKDKKIVISVVQPDTVSEEPLKIEYDTLDVNVNEIYNDKNNGIYSKIYAGKGMKNFVGGKGVAIVQYFEHNNKTYFRANAYIDPTTKIGLTWAIKLFNPPEKEGDPLEDQKAFQSDLNKITNILQSDSLEYKLRKSDLTREQKNNIMNLQKHYDSKEVSLRKNP